MKRFDAAVSAWRHAVEIDPSNHKARRRSNDSGWSRALAESALARSVTPHWLGVGGAAYPAP